MSFQSSVEMRQGFGVVGEIYNDSPRRVQPYILRSPEPLENLFGRPFTIFEEGKARVGGSNPIPLVGYLINPKSHVSNGTVAGGSLAPTLALPNDVVGELMVMGSMIVEISGTGSIGDWVVFDDVTGALEIAPPNQVPAGKRFGHAMIDVFEVSDPAPTLAVITITQVP